MEGKIGLTPDTINMVLKYLGSRPYVETATIIKSVMMEVQSQQVQPIPPEQTTLADHDILEEESEVEEEDDE